MKTWLSPHGQSVDIARWVIETKSHLLETDEYKNHITMRRWIEESQKIIDDYDIMIETIVEETKTGCAQE
jgi:hypothetical protein